MRDVVCEMWIETLRGRLGSQLWQGVTCAKQDLVRTEPRELHANFRFPKQVEIKRKTPQEIKPYFQPSRSAQCPPAVRRSAPKYPKAWKGSIWSSCRGASCRLADDSQGVGPVQVDAAQNRCKLHLCSSDSPEPGAGAQMRSGQTPTVPMSAYFFLEGGSLHDKFLYWEIGGVLYTLTHPLSCLTSSWEHERKLTFVPQSRVTWQLIIHSGVNEAPASVFTRTALCLYHVLWASAASFPIAGLIATAS